MKTRNVLFLHIGTHKTGSSALQNVMSNINKKLRGEGICYLGCPKYFYEMLSSTTNNNTPLSPKSDEIVNKTVAELKTRMKRENIFGRHKFVVSGYSGDTDPPFRVY